VCKPCAVAWVCRTSNTDRSLGVFQVGWERERERKLEINLICFACAWPEERRKSFSHTIFASFRESLILLSCHWEFTIGRNNKKKEKKSKKKVEHSAVERNSNKTSSTLRNGKKLSERKVLSGASAKSGRREKSVGAERRRERVASGDFLA
jgi:hypothetical protein